MILLTGANGFLGTEIARQALASKWNVRATDHGPEALIPGTDYFTADILDPESFKPILDKTDVVIHAAGVAHVFSKSVARTASFWAVNETGTANVARAAAQAGVRYFVLISSVSVYGGSRNGGTEDSGCYPQGPYAESKYQGELRAIEIARISGMPLTVLRLVTLYGEGDPGNVARLMRTIDRERFIWIGNGSNCKNLLHREDAARACLLAAQRPAADVNVYNVSGPPCTMREVVEGLAGALEGKLSPFVISASWVRRISRLLLTMPVNRLQALGAMAQKWMADDVYDGSTFAHAFNFQTRISLTEGLRREVAWYRAEQAKRGR